MKQFKDLLKALNPTDVIVVVFYVFLTAMNIIFHSRVEEWRLLIAGNFIIILFVFTAANLAKNSKGEFWNQIHYWYLAPLILLTFKEIYLMVRPIRMQDYDYLLIQADQFLFRCDPTTVVYQIANPYLTEFLQIVYGSFYFLPIILGIDLLINKREKEFNYSLFAVVFGFFLSYVGYFLLPAIGPRFTLHDFLKTNEELPGLFLTNFLREVVNKGESITSTMANAADIVQRDVFPSGHTQMTLIVMYLAYKYKTKSRFFLIPTGIALIFSTIYLRYHYATDLLGGFSFMVLTMWSGKWVYNTWQNYVTEETPEFANAAEDDLPAELIPQSEDNIYPERNLHPLEDSNSRRRP